MFTGRIEGRDIGEREEEGRGVGGRVGGEVVWVGREQLSQRD